MGEPLFLFAKVTHLHFVGVTFLGNDESTNKKCDVVHEHTNKVAFFGIFLQNKILMKCVMHGVGI